MQVLLVSTYELGHQPLHLAAPAAALAAAGHDVDTLDLSVEPWDEERVAAAGAVAISTPMHTAMRLGLRAAARLRRDRPGLPVCLYGLYAGVARQSTFDQGLADRAIAGEYEAELVAWVDALAGGPAPAAGQYLVPLGRPSVPGRRPDRPRAAPRRAGLPPLERYAKLEGVPGGPRLAGYVEASHGCLHRCRHCPVPVVYDGRFRAVPEEAVLADVEAQVEAGARHITFGDPDFLNGPQHALRVARALHRRFPEVTFDCTTKVEHILRHTGLWPELAASGCLFVVSAFESADDKILERLDKGHTAAEAAAAVGLLRGHGIEVRPSLLPFTPWTTLSGLLELLDFVAALDLVENVDPVQYTIRLLLPDGSLLLDGPDFEVGPYDPARLTWTWSSPDPAVDRLQARLSALVEESQAAGEPLGTTYLRVRGAVLEAALGVAGAAGPGGLAPAGQPGPRPRLSEPWFCCAEPTEEQFGPVG